MKNTNKPLKVLRQKFSRIVPLGTVNRLAKNSGFVRRTPRKLFPIDFVLSFFLCLQRGSCSLSQWAGQLQALSGESLSKQGLDERLQGGCAEFCKALLGYVLKQCVQKSKELRSALSGFSTVLLQDSTTFLLKDSLRPHFKGNTASGIKKAVLRLKIILELSCLQLLDWGITSYCCNDQGAASNIHTYVRKGALVVRDLGYFSVDSFKKIQNRKAYFLSKLRFDTSLQNTDGKPLTLKALLKGRVVDRCVLLSKEQLPVRLVVLPVSKAVHQRRIEREKQDHDKRKRHTPLYYRFLGYDVFVTNNDDLRAAKMRALYRLRWQVEIMFKALKTGALHTKELLREIRTNQHRLSIVLSLMLCFVLLSLNQLYQPYQAILSLSIIKVLSWMCCNLLAFAIFGEDQLIMALQHYCCYEKRKRKNLKQKIRELA